MSTTASTDQPRYVVTASAYATTDVRPYHVRDRHTGAVVARMRTVGDARNWCDLLNNLELPDRDAA